MDRTGRFIVVGFVVVMAIVGLVILASYGGR
jgi:hypothetical protein